MLGEPERERKRNRRGEREGWAGREADGQRGVSLEHLQSSEDSVAEQSELERRDGLRLQ